jgi:hypothetical protein
VRNIMINVTQWSPLPLAVPTQPVAVRLIRNL